MENGADVDAVTETNLTPLHVAASLGNIEAVEVCIYSYSRIHRAGKDFNHCVAPVKVLLEANALKNARDVDNRTPYDMICEFGEAACTPEIELALRSLLSP